MTQTTKLLETLKKYLKARGLTYKQLAKEMDLSEATIKRSFSKQSFSLNQLEEICRILDIDFYDLAKMDKERDRDTFTELTFEQEDVLNGDNKLMIFLYFLIHGWSITEIVEEYNFSKVEAIQMSLKLEKLSLLELHPNNKVRMLISNKAFWKIARPVLLQHHDQLIEDFMKNAFEQPNESLMFNAGQFSEKSLKIIRKKIDNLMKEYNQLAEMDATLPLKNRYSTGILIGFRPWVASIISDLRRSSNDN